MSSIGTPGWVDDLSHALADLDGLTAGPDGDLPEQVVVQQVVSVPEAPERCWYLEISDSGVRAVHGRHPAPSVTLSSDLATAESVADGTLGAQGAFMEGRLRIAGDPTALVRVASGTPGLAGFGGVGELRSPSGEGST